MPAPNKNLQDPIYTQFGKKCHVFFSHLFVRSTANQNLCITMERVLLTKRWQKKSMTLIPQMGVCTINNKAD